MHKIMQMNQSHNFYSAKCSMPMLCLGIRERKIRLFHANSFPFIQIFACVYFFPYIFIWFCFIWGTRFRYCYFLVMCSLSLSLTRSPTRRVNIVYGIIEAFQDFSTNGWKLNVKKIGCLQNKRNIQKNAHGKFCVRALILCMYIWIHINSMNTIFSYSMCTAHAIVFGIHAVLWNIHNIHNI